MRSIRFMWKSDVIHIAKGIRSTFGEITYIPTCKVTDWWYGTYIQEQHVDTLLVKGDRVDTMLESLPVSLPICAACEGHLKVELETVKEEADWMEEALVQLVLRDRR